MRSFVFKDPKAYEGMTQEEKEAETKEMMGFFKSQVEGTPMVKAEKARVKVKRKAAEQKNG